MQELLKTVAHHPGGHFPYVYLDATNLHGRLDRNLRVVCRAAVVVATGINALVCREVLGNSFGEGFAYAAGDSQAEVFSPLRCSTSRSQLPWTWAALCRFSRARNRSAPRPGAEP